MVGCFPPYFAGGELVHASQHDSMGDSWGGAGQELAWPQSYLPAFYTLSNYADRHGIWFKGAIGFIGRHHPAACPMPL